MDRCRYPSKPCHNPRALKLNGELHRFCEQHRRQANQNQMRWSKRKQTVRGARRGDTGGDDDDAGRRSDDGESEDYAGSSVTPHHHHQLLAHHPSTTAANANTLAVNVSAAGASLSHMNLNGQHMQMTSFQDQLARGGPMVPPAMMAGNGARPPPPQPMLSSVMERGRSGNSMMVPPMQTATPLRPLLPPREAPRATEQTPDPAVHALLMLEHAANVVTMAQQPENEPANDDDDVRRDLKRAKSNEWMARPTLSPAGLPTVSALVNPNASIAVAGRSASWQPPPVAHDRESLGQWMQRKQASLPSLSNLPRIEKRPFDSISSSSAPPPPPVPSPNGYHHRGMEQAVNAGSMRGQYVSQQYPVASSTSETSVNVKVDPSAHTGNRAAFV